MRAKYINKTARRRTIRPDGDEIRALRRYRGAGRRSRRTQWLITGVSLAVVGLACYLFFWN